MHELGDRAAARRRERVLDQRGARLTRRPGRFDLPASVERRGVVSAVVVIGVSGLIPGLGVTLAGRGRRGRGARRQRDQS